jgi:hypothetical protein
MLAGISIRPEPAMNSSLVTADLGTHLKILVVALLAAMLIMWIGAGAHLVL